MFKHLKAFFAPRHELPPYVHFHLDDDGQRVFCDASSCHPAPEPTAINALLRYPIR